MKAVMKVAPKLGVEVRDVKEPQAGSGEILVKIKASGICGSDLHLYKWDEQAIKWKPPLPKIIGHEFCGDVIDLGPNVTRIEVGSRVAADSHLYCGKCYFCRTGRRHICENLRIFGIQTEEGSFAEYTVIPESLAFEIPSSISYEAGALFEPMGVAMHAVEQSQMMPGDVVAVLGSGTIGISIGQIAKASGASTVIIIGRRKFRLEFAQRAQAGDVTISSLEKDVMKTVLDLTNGKGADIVFEAAGTPTTVEQAFDVVAKSGRIVLVGATGKPAKIDTTGLVVYKEAEIVGSTGRLMFQTWERLAQLTRTKQVDPIALVTHRLPLNRVEEGFQAMIRGEAVKVLLLP